MTRATRLLQVRHPFRRLALAERVRRLAGRREVAREAVDLLELRGRDELAIDHVPMRGTVGAGRRDEPHARVLAVLLEAERDGHDLGRSDLEIGLGGGGDGPEPRLVGEGALVHVGLTGEGGDDVAVQALPLEDVEQLLSRIAFFTNCFSGTPAITGRRYPEGDVLAPSSIRWSSSAGFVLQVLLRAAALHPVERRLGDEEMPGVDDLLVVTIEEREEQRADVRAVDVGVAHEDDRVIAELREVLCPPSRPRRAR
jgi:hypothetical protein